MQSSIRTIENITGEVGGIEVRKIALIRAMEQIQRRIEELRVKLREEYGTDNINIADGVINYPQETPEQEKTNPEENGEADKKD